MQQPLKLKGFTIIEVLAVTGIVAIILATALTGIYQYRVDHVIVVKRGRFVSPPAVVQSGQPTLFNWKYEEKKGELGTYYGVNGHDTKFTISPSQRGRIIQILQPDGSMKGLGTQNPDGSWTGVTSVTAPTVFAGDLAFVVVVDSDQAMSVIAEDLILNTAEVHLFSTRP